MSAAGAAQEAYREQPETERTPARAEAELVARIAQYARRVGRSAFKGRVRVGIENAAVIAEGRNGKYTYIEYARFADDLVILIDAYKRHDWLVGAVDKRLREEFGKLQVEINDEKSRIVDLERSESFGFWASTSATSAVDAGRGGRITLLQWQEELDRMLAIPSARWVKGGG